LHYIEEYFIGVIKMKRKNILLCILLVFVLVLSFTVLSCSDGSDDDDDDNDLNYTEQDIGPAGGIIQNEEGAKLTVPAGALIETVTIGLASYSSYSQLEGNYGLISMDGCVSLKPDGLTFLTPATLEIPLFSSRTAGSEYAVFVYNEDTGTWYQEDNPGTVTSSGLTLQTEIGHFSSYSASSISGSGLTDFIDEYESQSNPQDAFDTFKNNFINNNGLMNQRKNVDDKCYKVCGVEVDIMTHYAGIEDQFIELTGKRSSDVETLQYYDDRQVNVDGIDYQIIFDIKVYIYWEETECGETWEGTLEITGSYDYWGDITLTGSFSIDFTFTLTDEDYCEDEDGTSFYLLDYISGSAIQNAGVTWCSTCCDEYHVVDQYFPTNINFSEIIIQLEKPAGQENYFFYIYIDEYIYTGNYIWYFEYNFYFCSAGYAGNPTGSWCDYLYPTIESSKDIYLIEGTQEYTAYTNYTYDGYDACTLTLTKID
jgi:hypothetical protein